MILREWLYSNCIETSKCFFSTQNLGSSSSFPQPWILILTAWLMLCNVFNATYVQNKRKHVQNILWMYVDSIEFNLFFILLLVIYYFYLVDLVILSIDQETMSIGNFVASDRSIANCPLFYWFLSYWLMFVIFTCQLSDQPSPRPCPPAQCKMWAKSCHVFTCQSYLDLCEISSLIYVQLYSTNSFLIFFSSQEFQFPFNILKTWLFHGYNHTIVLIFRIFNGFCIIYIIWNTKLINSYNV